MVHATKQGHTDCVELLLNRQRIDVNLKDETGDTAFIFACMKGHTDIVKLFLEEAAYRDIDFNAEGSTKSAYTWAVFNQHEEIVNLLKENSEKLKIDLSLKNKYQCNDQERQSKDFNPFDYGRKATQDDSTNSAAPNFQQMIIDYFL